MSNLENRDVMKRKQPVFELLRACTLIIHFYFDNPNYFKIISEANKYFFWSLFDVYSSNSSKYWRLLDACGILLFSLRMTAKYISNVFHVVLVLLTHHCSQLFSQWWNLVFLSTLPPLVCKKIHLGTKSRRIHDLFWPKLNSLNWIYSKLHPN